MKQTKTKINDITELNGVGEITCSKLKEFGLDTLLSIAVTSPQIIAEATGLSEANARKLVNQARENVSMNFQTAFETEENEEQKLIIPTGSKKFNELLKGGFQTGLVVETYGQAGSSKTQISYDLIIQLMKLSQDYKVILLDTEGSFNNARMTELAILNELDPKKVLKNIYLMKTLGFDQQIFATEEAEKLIKQDKNIKLFIIDSLMNHIRVEFQARGKLADRQQKLNAYLAKLKKIAMLNNILIYYTNQVMANPGVFYGDPITPTGGHILSHFSSIRLYLRRSSKGITAKIVDCAFLPNDEVLFSVTNKGVVDSE